MFKLFLFIIITSFFIGVIIFLIHFINKLNKISKKNSKTSKLEAQIKSINKKLIQIKNDLDILPNTDDEAILAIKETLFATKKKLEDEVENLNKIYVKSFFNKVYVIYSLHSKKEFSENIKKIYSIIAEKNFKNPNVEFLTKKELYEKISNFSSNHFGNIWGKNYIDVICLNDKSLEKDNSYIISPYINKIVV